MTGTGPDPAWLGADAAPTLLATIWATVDLERALRDLGRAASAAATPPAPPAAPAAPPAPPVEDPLLGARVVLVDTAHGRLAVAEPSTEGRLAATLARNDEGPAGTYVAVALGEEGLVARAAAARVRLGGPAVGPFGRALLVLDTRPGERHVILVPTAAVPSRP